MNKIGEDNRNAKNFLNDVYSPEEYIRIQTANDSNTERKAVQMEKQLLSTPKVPSRTPPDNSSDEIFDQLTEEQKSLFENKSSENAETQESSYSSPFIQSLSNITGVKRTDIKNEFDLIKSFVLGGFDLDALKKTHEAETETKSMFIEADKFQNNNLKRKKKLLRELGELQGLKHTLTEKQKQRMRDIMNQIIDEGWNVSANNIENTINFVENKSEKIPKELVESYLNVKYLLQQKVVLNEEEKKKLVDDMKILQDKYLEIETMEKRLRDASKEAEHFLQYMDVESLTNEKLQEIRSKITFNIIEFKRHIDKNITKNQRNVLKKHYNIVSHDELMELIYACGYEYFEHIRNHDETNQPSLSFLIIKRLEEKKGNHVDSVHVYNKLDELDIPIYESDEMRKKHILNELIYQVVESKFETEQKKFNDKVGLFNSSKTRKEKEINKEKIKAIETLKAFTDSNSNNILKYVLEKDKTKNGPSLHWNDRESLKEAIWIHILNNKDLKKIYYNTIINHFVIFSTKSNQKTRINSNELSVHSNELSVLSNTLSEEDKPFDFGFINTVVEQLIKNK